METESSSKSPSISIVMPVGDRIDDISVQISELCQELKGADLEFEMIVVLDGQKDEVLKELTGLAAREKNLQVIELARAFGESAALAAGFDCARGETIVTWPAYRQVQSGEIVRLVREFETEDSDMLIAVRTRSGASFDSFRRSTFHALFRATSGMTFRDLGCGVRIFGRNVVNEVALYGDQHRFFPALARRRGFRVREVELAQSQKDVFRGRYRLREYLHRLLDILTVFFLVRFIKKPLRFFGTIGFLVASFGVLFTTVLVVQRLFFDVGLAGRPALILASLLIVLGVQVFALGLIGELIIFTHATDMKEYAIRRVIRNGETWTADRSTGYEADIEAA